MSHPERIVCLTTETTEIVYALGAGDRVAGVSGYSVRPPEARKKPRVAAFSSVKMEALLRLEPDLVLAFSDVQKEIVRDLVGAGLTVLALNQRSFAEMFQAVRLIGGAIGLPGRAEALVAEMEAEVEAVRERGRGLPRRPRVFFEEWDDPLISGIGWVGEVIELSGGENIFAELGERKAGPDRVVAPEEVVRRDPEVIVASWCGKRVSKKRIRSRPGWSATAAVREGRIYEIKSPDILSPGPSLLRGLSQMQEILLREFA